MTNREQLDMLDNKQLARVIFHLSLFSEGEIYKWLEYDDLFLDRINEWANNIINIKDELMRWRREFDMQRLLNKEFFKGICPYTDKPCEEWNCTECEVEKAEREYLEKEDYE